MVADRMELSTFGEKGLYMLLLLTIRFLALFRLPFYITNFRIVQFFPLEVHSFFENCTFGVELHIKKSLLSINESLAD